MTRQEIAATYQLDPQHGEFIVSPGKFEGEPVWTPYFWDIYLNGGADEDDGEVLMFDVTDEDRAMFPTLCDVYQVRLWEESNGFVCSSTILCD